MRNYSLLTLASVILVIVDSYLVSAIENEEHLDISDKDQYRLIPDKKAGARITRLPAEDATCRECIIKAKYAYDRFQQYTYLNFYDQNPNITNTDQLAGIKTCREMKEVLSCYKQCLLTTSDVESKKVKGSIDYRSIVSLDTIYCEERYTPGHTSCRLADAHRCDKIRRTSCGNSLKRHADCLSNLLTKSGQDCVGHCTPARRFLQSQKFIWDMECDLRATYKSQCKDIVTIFCFQELKDTESNYGIYQRMNSIPSMADNLTNTCNVLQSPFACMDNATYGFYDYFGFNVTYACRGAEETMDSIKQQWQSIIDPYCGADVPEEFVAVEEVCPTPEPTVAPTTESTTKNATTSRAVTVADTTEKSKSIYKSKPGRCPMNADADLCGSSCSDDTGCEGKEKCCGGCCRSPLFRRRGRRPTVKDGTSKGGSNSLTLSYLVSVLVLLVQASLSLCNC